MPPNRPQTLKQARRAYQKRGPARPSASEIAQAERRVALQERADRIKEREARRKANVRKRDEKMATEREAAKKAGKPFLEDQKPHFKVGASQLRLGGFLNGVQRKGDSDATKFFLTEEFEEEPKSIAPEKQVEPALHYGTPNPPVEAAAKAFIDESTSKPSGNKTPVCSARHMPPPPIPLPPKKSEISDGTLEDCFPSNTQIQRELSPEPYKTRTVSSVPHPDGSYQAIVNNDINQEAVDADAILACISSQDLNFSSTPKAQVIKNDDLDLLAQISTQDLEFGDMSPRPVKEAGSIDQELLLAQISTQDLEFSQEAISTRTEIKSTCSESFTDADLDSFVTECGMEGFESALIDSRIAC